MTTKTTAQHPAQGPIILLGQHGKQFFACVAGCPVNRFHKTKAGARRYATYLLSQVPGSTLKEI